MSDEEPEQIRKLFIGGLSYTTTEDSLSEFFAQWGELTDCVVMQDPTTKRSRGFGFVTFKEAAMVDKCMSQRPHKLDGREVEAKRAVSREESHKPGIHKSVKRLFMGGIKESVKQDDVQEYFTKYGKVESVELLLDKQTGKKRGFGFVNFDDYDVVDKIVQTRRHTISGVSIEVFKAFSRDDIERKSSNKNTANPVSYYGYYNPSWGWDGGYTPSGWTQGYNNNNGRGRSSHQGNRGGHAGRGSLKGMNRGGTHYYQPGYINGRFGYDNRYYYQYQPQYYPGPDYTNGTAHYSEKWGNSGGWITQHPEYVIAQTNGNGKEGQIQTTGSGGTGGGIRGGGFKGQNGGNTRGSKGTGSGTRTGQRGRQAFQQQSTQAQPIQAQ